MPPASLPASHDLASCTGCSQELAASGRCTACPCRVTFADEVPVFDIDVLAVTRQPLVDRVMTIFGARGWSLFPGYS